MKTAQQWWDDTADDEAWISNQAAIIERIQRESFAAGFAEGVETTARGIEGHAAKLGSNLAVPMPASVPRGLTALAATAREVGIDPANVAAAFRRAGGAVTQTTKQPEHASP